VPHHRHYEIAGVTVRVESELPVTDGTFAAKFERFRVERPGADTVVLRHHFGLPDEAALAALLQGGEEVYRHPPWAIARTPGSWVYLGIAPEPGDPELHRVAVFDDAHALGELHNPAPMQQVWREGGLSSLSLFPSDQIWIARLLADREACYLHSGGMVIDGRGFLFVGHSDAGKSTTMELVRGALGERAEILCDDRNIVRWWPEGYAGCAPGFCVHGTWSHGDVPDVSAAAAPLAGILFLEQAARNELEPIADRRLVWQRLLATLIRPLVTADWWNKELDVLQRVVDAVPCFTMRFDRSGAIVPELERLAAR
jgi:hypothetical protein